ncbi:MAG: four helix bundle protein, partial [Kiritimatiellales bacterium]|nr:four helix bundle protein [Kiritimatiellales bacterium]
INSAKDLEVYKKADALSMEIFRLSKARPVDERYSWTDQIRRSSRSVCSNLREAWAKRSYEAHFVSTLSDCDGENSETDTWLDYARDCGYLNVETHAELTREVVEVGKMLGRMLNHPASFLLNQKSDL